VASEASRTRDPNAIERVRRREPDALEAFFERYFGPVYALAHRLLGDKTAAEDVTQEVFLKVHRAIDQLDPARDPWPWIATITHNACRDVWRSAPYRMSRRSDSLEAEPGLAERLPGVSADPERLLLANERERLVREAIEKLPEHLREAVLLFDYRGLTHLEAARMLGIEHAAARKRYSRALSALAERLKEKLAS